MKPTARRPSSSRWWLAAMLALICVTPVHAQFSRDPVLNMTLRRQLGMRSVADNGFEALQSLAQIGQLRKMAADELAAARRQYWATYPDKPGFSEAERELSRQLTRLELAYLRQTMGTGRPERVESAINVLADAFTGGSRGFEISFAAQNLFFNGWVPAMRRELGASAGGFVMPRSREHMLQAMAAAQPEFDAYMIVRDLEEFRLARRTPPGFEPHYWTFVSGAVDLLDQEAMPFEQQLDNRPEYRGWSNDREVRPPYPIAERLYRDAERLFGAERIRAAYAQVVNASGPVLVPPELGRWRDSNAFAAMMNLLGSGSARAFVLGSLRGGGRSTAEWSYAEQRYAELVKAAGSEAALLSAAEKLRLAPKDAGSERENYPMLTNPTDYGSDYKAVEAVLRDMLGVGERAKKATNLARITELRRAYDFSGEYVVTGQFMNRAFMGTVTIAPADDGTVIITTRVDNLEWQQPRTIRQVARWHDENEIRMDADPVGVDFPAMNYLVDFSGRSLRGKWGHWEQDLGRVELQRTAEFRAAADVGGTYDFSGPRSGTVVVSARPDGSYTFNYLQVDGPIQTKFQGIGRWLGPTLKVDFKDKFQTTRQYAIRGYKPGEALMDPWRNERLIRQRVQPTGDAQSPVQPTSERSRRRSQ